MRQVPRMSFLVMILSLTLTISSTTHRLCNLIPTQVHKWATPMCPLYGREVLDARPPARKLIIFAGESSTHWRELLAAEQKCR